jgi:hypothetical protein
MNVRERILGVIAIFSFFILSASLVLWKTSNQNLKVAAIAAALFLCGIIFSRQKVAVICASLLFAGVRWGIGAIFTHDQRAATAALLFLSIPVLLFVLDTSTERFRRF